MSRLGRQVCAVIAAVALAPAAASAAEQALSAGAHEFTVGEIRLWYRVAGVEGGAPVVFLHGGPGQGSQAFQGVGGPQLERTQRLVYFDQRGSGRSARPKDPAQYSIDIMVEDIEHLRQRMGVAKLTLLGHSFGAQLALEYAARRPERTEALILAAATPHLARSLDLQCQQLEKDDPQAYERARQDVPEGALPRCNSMRAYAGEAFRAFSVRNLFPDPATADLIERLDRAEGLGNTGEAAAALFQKGLLRYRFADADKVTAPVLVIAGGRDRQAALVVQRELVDALPNGRLLVYPDGGHFMFAEEPERFARDVTAFLRDVRR